MKRLLALIAFAIAVTSCGGPVNNCRPRQPGEPAAIGTRAVSKAAPGPGSDPTGKRSCSDNQ